MNVMPLLGHDGLPQKKQGSTRILSVDCWLSRTLSQHLPGCAADFPKNLAVGD